MFLKFKGIASICAVYIFLSDIGTFQRIYMIVQNTVPTCRECVPSYHKNSHMHKKD